MIKKTKDTYDVAIVGAGMAGLYCAWRILRHCKEIRKPSIVILERLERVGGRLKTASLRFGSHDVVIEEGGMRFLNTHRHLNKILEELGLIQKKVKFGMGDDNNFYYIRGRRFTRQEAKDSNHEIWQEIYSLLPNEVGKSPFKIVEEAVRSIIQQQADPDDWKLESPFVWARFRQMQYPAQGGWPIYKWGFRALLEHLGLSNECVQMLMDTGGFTVPYEDIGGAGSGLHLIASFPEEPDFYTLIDGYDELPRRLHEVITKLGAETRLGCTVRKLRRDDKALLELETDGKHANVVHASKVILALPAVPMSSLLREGHGIQNVKTAIRHLKQVVHMPLTKINLYFEENWWEDKFKIKNGGCFTDIPLAQVYFFQLETEQTDRKFTAITIYSDGRRANYWRQLQELGDDYGYHGRSELDVGGDVVRCKEIVVEHALKQLRSMFSPAVISAPLFATISMWGAGDMGEGDHQWAIGADDEKIRNTLVKIDDGVFLCGEAISDNQDWVEGALRSAEHLVQANFGLEPLLR
ncbi:MAG: hypothetical protein QOJ84_3505 [Bradyrhizobium sp.]|nr:hypothetical protein [Bradyrhizobium sp.]